MQPYKAWMLQDLIEKNKRLFRIPVYQRNYDWSEVQCIKLFKDIMDSFNKDKKHFTGSIIYIKGERCYSGLEESMIIDGQQRITTIFILLKVIYDKAVSGNETIIINEIEDLLFNRNCEEEHKLKLKPVKVDDEQFQLLMEGRIDEMLSESNITKNYKLFNKLIDRELVNGYMLRDILRGLKNLEIVELVLNTEQGDDPQTIFESINSTGLDLSLSDLVRNYVLMNDFNQDILYERYWLYMEKLITTDYLADFIINYLNFKMSDNIKRNNAYEKFKELYINNNYSNESILKELTHYARYYALFIGKDNNYSAKINKIMNDFRLLDQSTIYVFLFSLFDDFEQDIIEEDTLIDILIFFRNYCLRRIICEIPSNSLRGLFKTLYKRLFKDVSEKNNYYQKIFSFFSTLRSKDKMPEEIEYRQKLIYGNLYNKKKVCKFLLASIENENCSESIEVEPLTIEHVLPQKELDPVWKKEIGDNYIDVYNTYLHTLGNLTITGYNSELGTKSFKDKKSIIRENSKANRLNRDILSQESWGEKPILSRARTLSDRIIDIFKHKEIEIQSDESMENDILTFEDIRIVPGTKPTSLNLCGEIKTVSSYSEMLTATIKILSSLDIKKIKKLAEKNFKLKYADRVYISFDETLIRRAKELDDTGVYYETNLSASNLLQFIKELLLEFGFDEDDFNFTIEKDIE